VRTRFFIKTLFHNFFHGKLILPAIVLYVDILTSFSPSTIGSGIYKIKKITPGEINFVTGYYHQNGDRSPVTGGIETEKLKDMAFF
jgi:hypothetical protein